MPDGKGAARPSSGAACLRRRCLLQQIVQLMGRAASSGEELHSGRIGRAAPSFTVIECVPVLVWAKMVTDLRLANCLTAYGLRLTAYDSPAVLRLTAYDLRLTTYGLRLTTCGLRLTAYNLWLTAYDCRLTTCGLRLMAYGYRLTTCGLRQAFAMGNSVLSERVSPHRGKAQESTQDVPPEPSRQRSKTWQFFCV